ncbi:MAG: nitroreductase family deazaflavin-dependent oxidoreductase [Rubrobacter sp.]|nr:nitroreductase family deazaflavin-dependent oxidoreductase [Rubrobacter sp.]
MNEAGLRRLSGEAFCYLTTVGRKTGRPHEIEIWFAVAPDGDALYMLSGGRDHSDWVRNLMKEPKVRIRIADETFDGSALVIEGGDEDPLARDLLVEKYERKPGKLSRWRQRSLPVRVGFSS